MVRLYRCDCCGNETEWNEGCSRYGNMLTEEFNHEIFTCSDECRKNIGDPEKAFKAKYGRGTGSSYYKC